MTIILDSIIVTLTACLVAYILWLARPTPRRITRHSEFRRRRLWLIRYRTCLLIAVFVGYPIFFYAFQLKEGVWGVAHRAFYIVILIWITAQVVRHEIILHSQRRALRQRSHGTEDA
jgi:hypothetical protein